MSGGPSLAPAMDFSWLYPDATHLGAYDQEHRTVYVVRLAVHFTGTLMIFTGTAKHSFLLTNRRLMVLSMLLVTGCMVMEEVYSEWEISGLRVAKLACFLVVEACLGTLILLGSFLLRSLTLKETYRLNGVFYLSIGFYVAVILSNNTIKLGYLGDCIISCVGFFVLREFFRALQLGGGGKSAEAQNVQALILLQGVLSVLNFVTFIFSFYDNVFGLKLASYVLRVFTITLFYLFVRPYLEAIVEKPESNLELLDVPKDSDA